jgi:hypothetical protein
MMTTPATTTTLTTTAVEEEGAETYSYETQVKIAKENLERINKEMQRIKKDQCDASLVLTGLILSRHTGMEGIFDHVPTFDSFLTGQELVNCIKTCNSWKETLTKRDDTYKKFLQWKCTNSGVMERIENEMKRESIKHKEAMRRILKNAKQKRILHPITMDRRSLAVDNSGVTQGWSDFNYGISQSNEVTTVRNFWKHGYKEIARDDCSITFEAESIWTFVERNCLHTGNYYLYSC